MINCWWSSMQRCYKDRIIQEKETLDCGLVTLRIIFYTCIVSLTSSKNAFTIIVPLGRGLD